MELKAALDAVDWPAITVACDGGDMIENLKVVFDCDELRDCILFEPGNLHLIFVKEAMHTAICANAGKQEMWELMEGAGTVQKMMRGKAHHQAKHAICIQHAVMRGVLIEQMISEEPARDANSIGLSLQNTWTSLKESLSAIKLVAHDQLPSALQLQMKTMDEALAATAHISACSVISCPRYKGWRRRTRTSAILNLKQRGDEDVAVWLQACGRRGDDGQRPGWGCGSCTA